MKLYKWQLITFPWVPYSAMAIWPFILLKHSGLKEQQSLIFHEQIHHRQQLELLIVPFYLLYLINYLINLFIYRNHYRAYREIIFEREAFANDAHGHYLKKRQIWAFLNYI